MTLGGNSIGQSKHTDTIYLVVRRMPSHPDSSPPSEVSPPRVSRYDTFCCDTCYLPTDYPEFPDELNIRFDTRFKRSEINRNFGICNYVNTKSGSRYYFSVCTIWPYFRFWVCMTLIPLIFCIILSVLTATTFMEQNREFYYDSFIRTTATFVRAECQYNLSPYTTTSYYPNETQADGSRRLSTNIEAGSTYVVYIPASRTPDPMYNLVAIWKYFPEPEYLPDTRNIEGSVLAFIGVDETPPQLDLCAQKANEFMNNINRPMTFDGFYNKHCTRSTNEAVNQCLVEQYSEYDIVGFVLLSVVVAIIGIAISVWVYTCQFITSTICCGRILYINSYYIDEDSSVPVSSHGTIFIEVIPKDQNSVELPVNNPHIV